MASSSVETQHYTDTLPVKLTETEALERADQATRLLQERDDIEARMKADMSQRKADIQEKEARMRSLSEEVRQRRTYKHVDCERRYDYSIGKIFEVRMDTGEIVSEREMTHAEKQRGFDFAEKENGGAGGGGRGRSQRSKRIEEEADAEGTRIIKAASDDEAAAAEEAANKVRGRRSRKTKDN